MKIQLELNELSRKTLVRIAIETSDSAVLEELSKNASTKVLAAVASNDWTRRETVIRLSTHRDKEVQSAALKALGR